MKLTINPTVLFRVPKFSYEETLKDNWKELKSAIAVSSTEFHHLIKDVTEDDIDALPEKVRFTLWKYFNRARFRATPFGMFAGYGTFPLDMAATTPIIIENSQTFRTFIDWPQKSNVPISLDALISKDGKLITNSAHYFVSGRLRYLAKNDEGFELCEESIDTVNETILNFCIRGIKANTLIKKLMAKNISYDLAFARIEELIDLQVLFTSLHPNIIGRDYFHRLNIAKNGDQPEYIIAERGHIEGSLPETALKYLPELIKKLQAFGSPNKNEALESFTQQFIKKFEQREIPLMIALDPEIGIGYDRLESAIVADDFVKQFTGRDEAEQRPKPFKDYLKDRLFKKDGAEMSVILLDDIPQPEEVSGIPLPNSLHAIVTIANNLTCIESLGGCTSNMLLGRFTLGDQTLTNHCRSIAHEEATANPDVFFFDIGYMEESYVDNINRRHRIYDTQLSILNFDTSKNPIRLSDILVSVQEHKIILRSKSMNKRLIPRMASAYNFTRSDLSVFRLLCDLQYQGICNLSTLNLENTFPSLNFYPRVQYKNILLSTCKWRLMDLRKRFGTQSTIENCRAHLRSLNVNRYFKIGAADQTLCFDVNKDRDMEAFLQLVRKEPELLLTEVIVPDQPLVRDASGKPYFSEFIVTITHSDTIYNGLSRVKPLPAKQIQSIYPPGSNWMYFEIFCHPMRTNVLLLDSIMPYIKAHERDISQWFFIRYNENGEHIRLRIKIDDKLKCNLLTADLSKLLLPELQSGKVADLQVKTYKREIERYHPEYIEAVESHFHLDSNFVLSILVDQLDDMQRYQICHTIIDTIITANVFESDKFLNGIRMISDYFNVEHKLKTDDFKNLNDRYKLYLKTESHQLSNEQEERLNILVESFTVVLRSCRPEIRMQMLRDMMHMHVNRMFSDHQRTHEMVFYYFVSKDIKRRTAVQSASKISLVI